MTRWSRWAIAIRWRKLTKTTTAAATNSATLLINDGSDVQNGGWADFVKWQLWYNGAQLAVINARSGNTLTLSAPVTIPNGATITIVPPVEPDGRLYTFVQHDVNSAAGTVQWDHVQVEEGEYPTAYAPKTEEILPGSIRAEHIQAGSITTDHLTSKRIDVGFGLSGGYPNTGVRLTANASDTISGQTRPLQIGKGGAQVGPYTLDEPVLRSLTALGVDSNTTPKRVFYRGNDNRAPVLMDPPWSSTKAYTGMGERVTYNGSVWSSNYPSTGTDPQSSWDQGGDYWDYIGSIASQERLIIETITPVQSAGTLYKYEWKFALRPRDINDSLDTLRSSEVLVYNTAGTPQAWMSINPTERRWVVPTDDGSDYNSTSEFKQWLYGANMIGVGNYFNGYLRVVMRNAIGTAERDYGPGVAAAWTAYPGGVTIPGQSPAPPPGDPPDTGRCVAPETPILMADGTEKTAGEIVVGDRVLTLHETDHYIEPFTATAHEVADVQERLRVSFVDGRSIICTPTHRFYIGNTFLEANRLHTGISVYGPQPGVVATVEPMGAGPVVKMTVQNAHTYIGGGVVHHNIKNF